MNNENVCQACYRVMLHKNVTPVTIFIENKTHKIECCLQCAGNLAMEKKVDISVMERFTRKSKDFIEFLDPLEYRTTRIKCRGCGMKTTRSHCFECSWKLLRNVFDNWMIKRIDKYADFENLFSERRLLNKSYLWKKI